MRDKQPTLDEFIAAYKTGRYPSNLHVREQGFVGFYVRMTPRWLDGEWRDPTLDLATIEARHPGTGTLTRLLQRLRKDYPAMTIYVECVLNTRFQNKLLSLGFVPRIDDVTQCFYLLPWMPLNHAS